MTGPPALQQSSDTGSRHRILIAVFSEQLTAQRAVERLIEKDAPMDSISILGRAGASGDDPLGIYYGGVGERVKAWGAHGAFWGGLWGLLAGAAGLFVVPGLGAILAAGPVVEAIAGALAGATLTSGVMAGAAAVSELAIALHRMGVPKERLAALQRAVEQGRYVVLVRCAPREVERWRQVIGWAKPDELDDFPMLP